MVKHIFILTFGSILLCSQAAQAQTPAPPAPPGPVPAEPPRSIPAPPPEMPNLEKMREQLAKVPPEQRQRIMQNLKRLQDMPPDQKKMVMDSFEHRKMKFKEAVDQALVASGLQLNEEEKQKFTRVYMRNRRDMEETLRKEMDARREKMMPELNKTVLEQYRKEAAEPSPTPASVPVTEGVAPSSPAPTP